MKNFAQTVVIPGIPKVALDNTVIGTAMSLTFTAIGGICVLFILIGAIRYATSNGEQKEIGQAKNTILYAVIGLIVSSSAVALIQFVLGRI
ncbi:MAG TPA: hypothetical protein VLA77_00760 [Candidatus Saccharimonadales bacterium]|nr:hypothetical protein [Candidatus Saccharimonadales bacterium]